MAKIPNSIQITLQIVCKVSFWDSIKMRICGRDINKVANELLEIISKEG